jgi:hypothetical protein
MNVASTSFFFDYFFDSKSKIIFDAQKGLVINDQRLSMLKFVKYFLQYNFAKGTG